jgi:ABC-type Na+ transport system ATPase subunit NatA
MLSRLMHPDAGTIRVDNAGVVADPIGVQTHMGLLPDLCGRRRDSRS